MKSGSLYLLEPSGPHRACYGIPLPLPFTYGSILSKNIFYCLYHISGFYVYPPLPLTLL